MGAATGTLKVISPSGTETFQWNGILKDREAAKAEFDLRVGSGSYMATVVDSPGKAHTVRAFSEVEQVEKEKGQVEVRISPAIVGG